MAIDFDSLAARLLQRSRHLLAEWFPAGKVRGHEFVVGDLAGSDGESLSINLNTGQWADFAGSAKGGDLISLYAAMNNITQAEAARQLDDGTIMSRIAPEPKPKQERGEWTPLHPVPDDAPTPTDEWYRKETGGWVKYVAKARWRYADAHGRTLGYVCRFEWYNAAGELAKDVLPQSYCVDREGKRQWRWRSFAEPRPLYNLQGLAERPSAPVIVVEGEKKVEALRTLAPQYVGIAWAGGSKAWRKTDWSPLKGRRVLLWPDNDLKTVKTDSEAQRYKVAVGELIPRDLQPGILAMWEIGHHILRDCPEVKIILPAGKPDGWDAADAVEEGMDWQAFKAWALPLVQQLTGATDGQRQRGQGDTGVSSQTGRGHVGGEQAIASGEAGQAEWQQADGVDQAQARPGERDVHEGQSLDRDRGSGGSSPSDRRPALGPGGDAGGAGRAQPSGARPAGRDHADRALHGGLPGSQRLDGPASVRTASDPAQDASRPAARQQQGQNQVAQWLAWSLDRNGNGLPYTNLNNAVRVMEVDPNLRGLCWYDEFLQRVLTGNPAREWTDTDDIDLTLYMQRNIGLTKIGVDVIRNAVIHMARRDKRNCVKDWMTSLAWDGKPRIASFFRDVFGAPANEYTEACGRNFWVSMAARAFSPGCKVDTMIVLEGAQGLGKSQAVSIIGGDWYAEQHESAANPKAFAENLEGKLVIEVSEMDAFDRTEIKRVKATISCFSDRYRGSYERKATDHKRQCVLIGTTNKDDWNRDDTGARRFWPIRCEGLVRLDRLAQDRSQLFAEALASFRSGASWWEMPGDATAREQRARFSADPWIADIEEYLDGRNECSINDVLRGCIKLELAKIGKFEENRVASCLRHLKWINVGNVRRNGAVLRMWRRGEVCSDPSGRSDPVATPVATQNDIPFQ